MTASFYLLLIIFGSMISSYLSARTTGDYCLFDETLKHKFRSMRCRSENIDQCATKARKIAQESLSGKSRLT
jgi:hypothetical protein